MEKLFSSKMKVKEDRMLDAKDPKDLMTELIKSGVKTIVYFDDGSQFELN